MSLSFKTQNALAIALTSEDAANEITSALTSDAPSSTPSFTTVTTTGDATIGGNVKVPTGKGFEVNGIKVVGTQQTAVTPVAVTFTAAAPANYASPTGSLTIANGGTPTVVELVEYCDELRANIVALQAVLHAHGLTT